MRILIVEDETRLANTLADLLNRQGYSSTICKDGISGLDEASSGAYDLVILDIMLPGMDGFTLLHELRSAGSTIPVLVLTARNDLEDRVKGLDNGADYYLTKPFEPSELLACVRTLLRRCLPDGASDNLVTFGDLSLDVNTFQLTCGERFIRLSRHEYDTMYFLMCSGSQVITKEQLLIKVWGFDSEADDNNVEVYISFLRKKIEFLRSRVTIRTLRMIGYCLEDKADGTEA